MKIVFLGSGDFGIDCLNALKGSENHLSLVVTQPPQPAGRGKKITPTPVASWAKENAIEFIETPDVNTAEMLEKIASHNPKLIVVIAFGQKVSTQLTSIPPKGAINVHSSLLPKFRGAAPINWAIITGEKETGISIITLAEKMDAGDILAQAATPIEPNESAAHLHDRLARLAAPLLLETIAKIATGTAIYTPQDHSKATLAKKLKKSDAAIDFNQPAAVIKNRLLGLWPWPGAAADYISKETGKCTRVIFASAEIVPTASTANLQPGSLDENLNITCGKDALKIISLKPAGGSLMNFKDFCNGRSVRTGDCFIKADIK